MSMNSKLFSKKSIGSLITLIVIIGAYMAMYFMMHIGLIDDYMVRILVITGINIILALSLNLIIGFTGQLALGHAGFMSIGAYVSAVFTVKLGFPFFAALIIGTCAGGIASILIGYPILRLKGDYLAICTLSFGEIVKVIIQNIEGVGGPRGFSGIIPYTNFIWIYFSVIVAFGIIKRISNSSIGRTMKAISQDEIAAEALGNNAAKYKMTGFVIGSSIAAFAGGLYAHYLMFIDPVSFNFSKSTEVLTFVVLGGIGSLSGSVVGATILTILPELLRGLSEAVKDYRMLIYSIILVVLMIFRPQGILGIHEISTNNFKKLFKSLYHKIKRRKKVTKYGYIDG